MVGQIAHGVLNWHADALALDNKARVAKGNFKLEHFEMSDEILFRSITIKAASTGMKERISEDADF